MQLALNNIRLLVDDFGACFRFYKEDLELECTWGSPTDMYASFNIGLQSGLALFKSDLMADAVGTSHLPAPAGKDKAVIVIRADDLDNTYKQLVEKGIRFINTPTDMPQWGIRTVHLRDPAGNLLELFSDLPMEKWDKSLAEQAKKQGEGK